VTEHSTPKPPSPDRPFEIGLVMAGAISAGAYTAGVIDFLIQALDQWEKAKEHARTHPDDPTARDCPMHEVRIKVLAGASAGGMTAGIAAGLLGMEFQPVTEQTSPDSASPPIVPVNNTLYRSWVNTIDIAPLLGSADLDADPTNPLQSVLYSTIVRTIAADAFTFERPDLKVDRPYLRDPLHVLLSVTNLRGVTYPVTFSNFVKRTEYEMTLHGDSMHFVIGADPSQDDPDGFGLRPYDFQNDATWGVLRQAAVATGAFPVGLAPQLLSRPPAQYEHRAWAIPRPCPADPACSTEEWKAIPPLWPSIDQAVAAAEQAGKSFEYQFLCVDGGVTNNEPLDLARRILAGPDGVNPREGDKATRAVIMIMPFPNAAPFEVAYSGVRNLVQILGSIFQSLISQARFKPEELTVADDPNVYSRFLIVPRRTRPDGTAETYPIACGSLEGFGGFLSRRFREHDYQLGRRNCQWFLKQYFALPSDGEQRNQLFDHWTDEARDRHRIVIRRPAGPDSPTTEPDRNLLPIIPLMGTAAADVPIPTWPTYLRSDFAQLRNQIRRRLRRIALALINQNVEFPVVGILIRLTLKVIAWVFSFRLVRWIMKAIEKDLMMRGLMR
jgi:hypothetical protein